MTGLVLIGVGAGLLLPTATNSVVGAVPQGDSGIGSAVNTTALQVGGALGVAVIGSAMLTRYQNRIAAVLAGRHIPAAAAHAITSSLGGALTVANRAGGATGALLAHDARASFMSGMQISLTVGALVALTGAILALTRLPSRDKQQTQPNAGPPMSTTAEPPFTSPIRGRRELTAPPATEREHRLPGAVTSPTSVVTPRAAAPGHDG